jgi:hypothetical protein
VGWGVESLLGVAEGSLVMVAVDDVFDFAGDGGGSEFHGCLFKGSFDDFAIIFANAFVSALIGVHGDQ